MSLLNQVREAIRRYNLLSRNDRVIVGVSGGPDSVALLCILNSLKREFKLNLHIAHLDHQLRAESRRERQFVESLAGKLQLPFSAAKVNIGKIAKKGSLEEIAREERLNFFLSLAKKLGADKIALGHNQDDQAETVLMRLIRGTGLLGLGSILPKRNIGKLVIIRPLIEIPRKAIDSYLNRKRIKPCLDLSNRETVYFRNRVRNRLMPQLARDYNPGIKQSLANMAQIFAGDYDYLEKTALKALDKLSRPALRNRSRGIRLELNRLSKLHPAIQRLVLRLCLRQIKGSTRRLTLKHIKEIEDLILNRPLNSIVDLPGGLCVIKEKRCICVYQRKQGRRANS
jgi:tRNA(Ile)-lysidine synthase